jgi:DNA methylase
MGEPITKSILKLSAAAQEALIVGARNTEPVQGLTHGFYKYPARFSPEFVRAAIETFTKPGDLILDPLVGGGTSLVEALASGREAVGVDINPLAEFVARVKCIVFSEAELDTLEDMVKPSSCGGSFGTRSGALTTRHDASPSPLNAAATVESPTAGEANVQIAGLLILPV